MRIVVAGTPVTACPSLEALLASGHDVVAVVTRPDARAGRGRSLVPSPVKVLAQAHGVPVLAPVHPRDPDFLTTLAELAPDACAVVAYGALLHPEALAIPTHGWINLHFSLLPAWRGAAPVQRAIMAGDEVTGASTFLIEEGLDTGPVFGMMTEAIRPADTAGGLLDRLAHAGAPLLVATLDGIADGSLAPRPQPAEGVSLAPKLSAQEAEVRWSLPGQAIDRVIRGCTPDPGAWTSFRGARLGLGPVQLIEPVHASLAPGQVLADKKSVLVGTGTGPVLLDRVTPAGKKEMAAADWARGARLGVGEVLGQ